MLARNKNPPGSRLTSHLPECQDLSVHPPTKHYPGRLLPLQDSCMWTMCIARFLWALYSVYPSGKYISTPSRFPSSLIPLLPHSMTGSNLILNAPSICSGFSPHIASQMFFAFLQIDQNSRKTQNHGCQEHAKQHIEWFHWCAGLRTSWLCPSCSSATQTVWPAQATSHQQWCSKSERFWS